MCVYAIYMVSVKPIQNDSFVEQISTEQLLCGRQDSGYQDRQVNKWVKKPKLHETYILVIT